MMSMALALSATLAALAGVIWSGATRRRDLHYKLIALMFVLLGVAIWRAEVYGKTLRFEGTAATLHTVHMVAVVLTFLLVPLVVISGVRLARARGSDEARQRLAHKQHAVRFVVLLLITSVLGTVMTVLARPA